MFVLFFYRQTMEQGRKMKLVLEDGTQFSGEGFGAHCNAVGELIFNTSMVGYQEILSDPAYTGQMVVMTYPLMGQYGITAEDNQSRLKGPAALIVRECCQTPSNFRYIKTLAEELEEHDTPCVAGLDTRMLTRILREKGSVRAAVVDEEASVEDALKLIAETPADPRPVEKVSCRKRWFSRTPQHNFDVVLIDCGVKYGVVADLNRKGCNVTIVPHNTSYEDIMSFNPSGVLIAGGPGDPRNLPELVEVINRIKGQIPVFGINIGQGLIGLSYGAEVEKLKCGFHGGRAVRNTSSGRIVTAEANHGYALKADSVKGTPLTVSYTDVATGTIEGVECEKDRVSAVQFYPEGGPGPEETLFFDEFVIAMEG